MHRFYLSLEESWHIAWLTGFDVRVLTAEAHEAFIELLEDL